MLGPRQSGHMKLRVGAVSHHQSLRELFSSLLPIFFFFESSLSLLLPLPFTAAHERLFLELTWLFKDVKFTLCHGFWGRKLLVCFLPPNLLFISFSVSSCCLSKALSLSPTHFLFLIYPCVSPSPLQSDLPPHTYTLLLIPPSLFFVFVLPFPTGKRKEPIFQSALSSFATFCFSACGKSFQSGTSQSGLQLLHFTVRIAKESEWYKETEKNFSDFFWNTFEKSKKLYSDTDVVCRIISSHTFH